MKIATCLLLLSSVTAYGSVSGGSSSATNTNLRSRGDSFAPASNGRSLLSVIPPDMPPDNCPIVPYDTDTSTRCSYDEFDAVYCGDDNCYYSNLCFAELAGIKPEECRLICPKGDGLCTTDYAPVQCGADYCEVRCE